jgi:O-antigen ligase
LFGAPGYLFLQALNKADDSVAGHQIKFYAMSGLSLLVIYAVAGQSLALFEHDVFNHFFALMVLLFASQIRVIGYMEENSRAAEVSGT